MDAIILTHLKAKREQKRMRKQKSTFEFALHIGTYNVFTLVVSQSCVTNTIDLRMRFMFHVFELFYNSN